MPQKKTTIRGKTWRFGGESLSPTELSESEERLLTGIFTDFQSLSKLEPTLSVSAATMRSRQTAARACLGYFCEQFAASCERETVTRALSTALALPIRVGGPDESSTLYGAALWIADYVGERNLQSDLLALLPESSEGAEFFFPEAEDFRYPPEALSRVLYVLRNRKSVALKEFRKVMGLIRKDDAAKLRKSFRDALLDYFNRFLEVCKRVAPTPSLTLAPETAHPLSPLPVAKDLFSAGKKQPPPPSLKEIPARTPDMAFLIKTPCLIGLPPEEMRSELYYRRLSELLSEFTVRDPYEICAAAVLLERENDLLMNLNALTTAVLACAERHLPWVYDRAGSVPPPYADAPAESALRYLFRTPSDADAQTPEETSVPDDGAEATEETPVPDADAPTKEPSGGGAPAEKTSRLCDDEESPEGKLFSEGQLFYLATGYLLPRDRGPSDALTAWFQAQGLPEARARELSGAAMAFSLAADARSDADSGLWEETAQPKPKRAVREVPDAAPEPDDAERVGELTRQLKSVRQSAHEKEQTIRQLEEQLRDEQRRAEQDRMELRGLRDTLFRTRAGESSECPSAEKRIQLPCQIRRRVLIFGGHDTWSKSIRPLLPGARFYERESLPDLNAIKGADVVWIQANALSHKFYYRIIETARRENILVRYFGFASARKCAEQVAEHELSETSES